MQYYVICLFFVMTCLCLPSSHAATMADSPFIYTDSISNRDIFSIRSPQELKKLALAGDTDAMIVLGEAANQANIPNYPQWFFLAHQQGNSKGTALYGASFFSRDNPEEGRKYILQAMEQGEPHLFRLIIHHYFQKQQEVPYELKEKYLFKLIPIDSAWLAVLALPLLKNEAPSNIQKFLSQLQLLAKEDDPSAVYLLGVCALQGIGAEPSTEQALALFAKAADLKHGHAAWELYKIYSDKAMYLQAMLALKMAAENANYLALRTELDIIRDEPTFPPDVVAEHLFKAAEAGQVEAMANLGMLYAEGRLPGGNEEAKKWFLLAAQKGNGGILEDIAELYTKENTPASNAQAAYWTEASKRYAADFDEATKQLITPSNR